MIPIAPMVAEAMQREINRLKRELAVQKALTARLTQLPSILPPGPLHKPAKLGNLISNAKPIRNE